MPFPEFLTTFLVIAAAQGVFLAALLAGKRVNRTANLLLAVLMLACSIFVFEGAYYARGTYRNVPHLIGLSEPLIFVFGPLLLLYARSVRAGGMPSRKPGCSTFSPSSSSRST